MTSISVAGHALIERDGKFLVTRRSAINDYMPLKWDLPGGTIDAGETLEQGLTREVQEETTLQVEIVKPEFIFTNLGSYPERQVYQAVYSCRYVSGDVTLNPEEHDQSEWVTMEEVAKLDLIAFLQAFVSSRTNP